MLFEKTSEISGLSFETSERVSNTLLTIKKKSVRIRSENFTAKIERKRTFLKIFNHSQVQLPLKKCQLYKPKTGAEYTR